MATIKLTAERKKWVGKRDTTLHGKRLTYNASQQQKYSSALLNLVREMTEITRREILTLFRNETATEYFKKQKKMAAMDDSLAAAAKRLIAKLTTRFDDMFNSSSVDLSKKMVEGAKQTSETALKSSLNQLTGGLNLKTSVVTKGLEDVSQATVNENVSLIKTIPQQYLGDVTGAVMRSITTGNGLQDLILFIEKYDGMTQRRARNIALDQTRKAYNSINKQRLLTLGVKKFKWLHSGGGQHPRKDHIAMSGNIYSFDDLPVIEKRTGERGIPGQAINCRCTMTPVIEFEDGETY